MKKYLLIANFYFFLSHLPLLILSFRNPAGAIFPLFQVNHIPDYISYLSAITLGQNGYWFFRNPFTSEAPIPSIFYLLYILVGKLTAIFDIWPPIVYHLFRIFTVEIFLISIFIFCTTVLGRKLGIWASIFSLVGTIALPVLFEELNKFGTPIGFTPWWINFDAVLRIFGVPHHILGQSLLLLTLSLFFIYLRNTRKKSALLISLITSFTAGIIYPPSLFPIIFAIPAALFVSLIINIYRQKDIAIPKSQLFAFFWLFLSCGLSILLVLMQSRVGYHKSVWVDWEITRWNINETSFNKSLFLIFGILPIFSIPAIYKIIAKKQWEKIFLIFWAILPFSLLPFVNILSISKIRLIGAFSFVPWGLLCAETFNLVSPLRKRFIFTVLLLFFLAGNVITSLVILENDIKQSKSIPLYANIFIPQNRWKMIDFIKKNVPRNSIFLSDENFGLLLPAFTPQISYFGHLNLTYKFLEKQNDVWRFYTGNMTQSEMKNFLAKNNIQYIYFGPDEKGLGNVKSLPFASVEKIYEIDNLELYRIIR